MIDKTLLDKLIRTLTEKLRSLQNSYVLETRVEEKLRLKSLIEETERELREAHVKLLAWNAQPSQVSSIHVDNLPPLSGEFVGRHQELHYLSAAYENKEINIVQLIASGGMGKTTLLKYWLDQKNKDISNLLAWSFYSQGSDEFKQWSATPFFTAAFQAFNIHNPQELYKSEEAKGEALAQLLRDHHCFLVLDGLEPLLQAGQGKNSSLKDRGMRQLLKSLARHHSSLCVITTQTGVAELNNLKSVFSRNLHNLSIRDSISLLKNCGVKGHQSQFIQTVKEYGRHALALHLLGNALVTQFDGDIRCRDRIAALLMDADDTERHAFRVMQAYQHWLKDTPELKILYLLGLFNHPIESNVLKHLWQAKIPFLTADIDEQSWQVAIRDLKNKYNFLWKHETKPDLLDCHPLIREYFGKQLNLNYLLAWQLAHKILYYYYQSLRVDTDLDTVEQMRPLFYAVEHGCKTGLYQEVFEELYWKRIGRGKQYFLHKMGAVADDLGVLNHFLGCYMSKTFISYSHDSQDHKDRVRHLANQLRNDGIEAWLDQYENGFPELGWQRWMEQQIEQADFVLLICTPTYLKRYRGEDIRAGRGVNFEGVVISQSLYDVYYRNRKFIPLIPDSGQYDDVPLPLKAYRTYKIPSEYNELYRYLTQQPQYVPPPLGSKRRLPPDQSTDSHPATPTPNPSAGSLATIQAEREQRLLEKLRLLMRDYDSETRVEEKMRIKAIIEATEQDLRALRSA